MVMAGRMISHYRVLAELGRGGMGVIYRAEDTRLNREVALKLLSDPMLADEDMIKRFQREARAASALNHPHICTVYDVGEDQGTHFIAMELTRRADVGGSNRLACSLRRKRAPTGHSDFRRSRRGAQERHRSSRSQTHQCFCDEPR